MTGTTTFITWRSKVMPFMSGDVMANGSSREPTLTSVVPKEPIELVRCLGSSCGREPSFTTIENTFRERSVAL